MLHYYAYKCYIKLHTNATSICIQMLHQSVYKCCINLLYKCYIKLLYTCYINLQYKCYIKTAVQMLHQSVVQLLLLFSSDCRFDLVSVTGLAKHRGTDWYQIFYQYRVFAGTSTKTDLSCDELMQ